MCLNDKSHELLGETVFSPSLIAVLFVKIHIHSLGKLPNKLLNIRAQGEYRENNYLS